jgi:hypothetical protein
VRARLDTARELSYNWPQLDAVSSDRRTPWFIHSINRLGD